MQISSRYGEAGQEIHGKPAGTVMTVSTTAMLQMKKIEIDELKRVAAS